MKTRLNLKRLLSVALCLCLLLSTCVLGTGSALAANESTFSATATADETQEFVVEHDHDGWTPLHEVTTATQYIPSGNYYLEDDLTLTRLTDYDIGDEVIICLNGHTLYTDTSTINIVSGATLTLTDCTDKGMVTRCKRNPFLLDGGMFILENGTISGNAYYYGGAVYIEKGTFMMHGGSISGNSGSAVKDATLGGGVHMAGGTFIMEGGTISGNDASSGGGVCVENGDFVMRGGEISGNTADSTTKTYGGGVYVKGGTFTMEGGKISGHSEYRYGSGVAVTGGLFTMKGGEISGNDNTAASSFGYAGGVYVENADFVMKGGAISGNEGSFEGGGVYVKSGTFTLEGGKITNNTSGMLYGGGVCVETGDFTMTGGTISDCISSSGGSGVYVSGDATFTMEGGKISNNKLTEGTNYPTKIGGGVYVNGGVFNMKDGEICDNSACVGGGVYMYGGSFTMGGGTISGNSVTSTFGFGGGVYVRSGNFTMKDGEISCNTAQVCGGGVSMGGGYSTTDGVFVMQGGTISDNTATSDGGGVYITNGNTFTMENGVIFGNYARDGGGVCVKSADFTMENSTISDNTAKNNGGGVYIISGILTVKNSMISGNTAEADGGGVFVYDTMIVSGNTVVADNTLSDKATQNNIALVLEATDVLVDGVLTDNAKLGIHRLSDVKETPVLTQGYSEYHSDDAGKYFFYDNAEIIGNCDVGTGPDGEAWFGYNVTFKDKSGNILEEQFVGYNCMAIPIDDNCWSTEIGGAEFNFDTPITENLTLYSDSETILNPMSSQIRFQRNEDGSYANRFDVRTRAKIFDEDFAKYIAETNEEAVKKISKVGFVYSCNSTDFSITDAQRVAKGETVSGYKDAPVSYIQDADGYYMFTCIITDISKADADEEGFTAYAYICVGDKWYFYNAETTVVFKDLYEANYPKAAEEYGW